MSRFDISLYGILDPAHTRGRDLAELAKSAIEGGCTMLQLRNKQDETNQIVAQAKAILKAVNGSGVPVLINDHVLAARLSGAQGVHLGQEDMPVAKARTELGPSAIIGLTVKTIEEARNLPQKGLDYVSIGGVFDTVSKHNPASIGIHGWQKLANICRGHMAKPMPVCAIAGIDVPRAGALIEVGADGVAVLSALFMQHDVRLAAAAFQAEIQNKREKINAHSK